MPLGLRDPQDGYAVDGPDEAARRVVELVVQTGLADLAEACVRVGRTPARRPSTSASTQSAADDTSTSSTNEVLTALASASRAKRPTSGPWARRNGSRAA